MNLRRHAATGPALALVAIAALASLAAARARGQAPEPGGTREPAPSVSHLVGHEDAELLRRIQELIDDHDPRKLRSPYVEAVAHDAQGRPTRWAVKRQDLVQFIQDADAAIALGKALFWEMRAGSDFRRDREGAYVGTACASCHYRFGADPRDMNSVRIPYVGWDRYELDPDHPDLGFGERQQSIDGLAKMVRSNQALRAPVAPPVTPDPAPPGAAGVATLRVDHPDDLKAPDASRFPSPARRRPPGLGTAEEQEDDETDFRRRRTPLSLIVGSQGVEPRVFKKLVPEVPGPGEWRSEDSADRDPTGFRRPPQWAMFLQDPAAISRAFRQITTRNSPSVVDATFSDRLFHDVRAESTFNGFSIFGDFDAREVIHVRRVDSSGRLRDAIPAHIAITRAALASQAVGPIVNDVEMSYTGRTFHDLAAKLLDAPVLGSQVVSKHDSVLRRYRVPAVAEGEPGLGMPYRDLIQRAFRREWWDNTIEGPDGMEELAVPLELTSRDHDAPAPTGSLMEANFSLYWGLSLMLYQSTLVSNESPYDRMLRGDGDAVDALWLARRDRFRRVRIDRVRSTARRPEDCVPSETPAALPPPPAQPPAADDPFVLQSGTEVFQRGLRSFLRRGCVDCHQGPLLSEVYLRSDPAESQPYKPVPIGRQVANALLPVSRGDALAFQYIGARDRVLDRIGELLAGGGVPTSHRELMDFAVVFEREGGDEEALKRAVFGLLAGRPPDQAGKLAEEVAREWTTFEKTFVRRLGNRIFFNEDQRIALAGLIGDPLMVELMPIPPKLAAVRPRLPIGGRLARGPYAFYDTSVYAIGAGLPRYDRGGGEWTELVEEELGYPPELIAKFAAFLDTLQADLDRERERDPATSRASLESAIEAALRRFDRESHAAFRAVIPHKVRDIIRGMALDEEPSEDLRKLRAMVGAAEQAQAVALQEQAKDPARADLSAKARADEAASRLSFSRSAGHISAGAPGQAYRMASAVAEAPRPEPDKTAREAGVEPWAHPADADADARARDPRDLSWHRNLPHWDESPELGPNNHGFDSVDDRRSSFHFFARSRAMAQDESPTGRRKPLLHDNELAFWGSFKTPTLRNVDLTAPYMHNGRLQSLFDVLDFYDRGGDVPPDPTLNPDLAPAMLRLHMDEDEKHALVFFLMCLTDPRVAHERAPFDHPSLRVVNGYDAALNERVVPVEAVGEDGVCSPPKGFPDHGEPQPAPSQP
jgi:cytochrome c peroxidase